MLKQDIIRNKLIDKIIITKLDVGNNESKKYKIEAICISAIYKKKLKSSHLLKLYYLLF